MAQVEAQLLFIALAGTVFLPATPWARVRRLRELERKHDRLVRENQERVRRIFKEWTPRGGAS